jgi:hypothetical protein
MFEKIMNFFTGKKETQPAEVREAAKSAASTLRLDAQEVKEEVQLDAESARQLVRQDAEKARVEMRQEVDRAKAEITECVLEAREAIEGDADKVNRDAIDASATIRKAMKTLREMITVADEAMDNGKEVE